MKKMIFICALTGALYLNCGGGGGGSITVSKPALAPDEAFTVEYTIDQNVRTAWIGIFKSGADHAPEKAWIGDYSDWEYCPPGNGKVELTSPMEKGVFEVRLYSGGSETGKELKIIKIEVQ